MSAAADCGGDASNRITHVTVQRQRVIQPDVLSRALRCVCSQVSACMRNLCVDVTLCFPFIPSPNAQRFCQRVHSDAVPSSGSLRLRLRRVCVFVCLLPSAEQTHQRQLLKNPHAGQWMCFVSVVTICTLGNRLCLTVVFQAVALDDDDDDGVGPCYYCESHQHSSRDCPKRQRSSNGWMHKAQVLFETRQRCLDQGDAGGRSNVNGGSNHLRENPGEWHRNGGVQQSIVANAVA